MRLPRGLVQLRLKLSSVRIKQYHTVGDVTEDQEYGACADEENRQVDGAFAEVAETGGVADA